MSVVRYIVQLQSGVSDPYHALRFPAQDHDGVETSALYPEIDQEVVARLIDRARNNDPEYEPPRFEDFLLVEMDDTEPEAVEIIEVWARRSQPLEDPRLAAVYPSDARGSAEGEKAGRRRPAARPPAGGSPRRRSRCEPGRLPGRYPRDTADRHRSGLASGSSPHLAARPDPPVAEVLGTGHPGRSGARNGGARAPGGPTPWQLPAQRRHRPRDPLARTGVLPRLQGGVNLCAAILSAAGELYPGDVLLIEEQEAGGPPELLTPVFDLIVLATKADITVIEAPGNAGEELPADLPDSGAVIVGACRPQPAAVAAGSLWLRDFDSNWGGRLDCFAPGLVSSLGCGWPETSAACSILENTSAASALIAGVAASIQSMARCRGFSFSSRKLRRILSDPQTGSQGPSDRPLGIMPNLERIVDKIF